LLKQIVEWLEKKKIFRRKRKKNEKRALGMLLYKAGLSYRKAGEIVGVSHEAIREWYQKGRSLFAQTPVRKRKWIAIDEKEIDINGKKVYLWSAVDIDNEEVIAVMVTRWRCSLDTLRLLKKVREKCSGKLPRVFVDGGDWYPWALQRYGFRYTVVHFGPRSAVERWFSQVDWRIRRFWETFPETASEQSIERWTAAFAGFTNFFGGALS
jgi:transposase-like protein